MVQKGNNIDSCGNSNRNFYDKPIPKPPSELLDTFFSQLNEKFVTRRFSTSPTNTRSSERGSTRSRGRQV